MGQPVPRPSAAHPARRHRAAAAKSSQL